jgi:hypothetical protein
MSNSQRTSLNSFYLDLLRVAADSYREGNKQFIISKYNELSYSGSETVKNILNEYTSNQDIQNNFHSIMLFFLLRSLTENTSININDFVKEMNEKAKQLRHKDVPKTKPNVKGNAKQNSNQQPNVRTPASVTDRYDYEEIKAKNIADVKEMYNSKVNALNLEYQTNMLGDETDKAYEIEEVGKSFAGNELAKKLQEIEQTYNAIHKELNDDFNKNMTKIKNVYFENIEDLNDLYDPMIEAQKQRRLQTQSAGSLRKTAETVKINKQSYKVYLGKRGGRYVKKDGKFVPVSRLN